MIGVDERPLIAHVLFRFDTGGLENGVANLLDRLPAGAYRHAVVALTEVTAFRERVSRKDVRFLALGKGPGHGALLYPRLWRLFRALRPAIVHTRNLAALEATVPAWFARVPVRVHGEHGRDVGDLDGRSTRHRRLRKLYRPFVTRYVALSGELSGYLKTAIGVEADRVSQIYNGVDTQRFTPAREREPIPGCPFREREHVIVGTVGRLEAVKDQVDLARAFVLAVSASGQPSPLRLVVVGEGSQRQAIEGVLADAGVGGLAWLPGERSDVGCVLRGLDVFALPSLAEGISNTILEAMACGLPVVATRVGGNPELVAESATGRLVPASDPQAMASALLDYANDPAQARRHGSAGRSRVEAAFSIDRMVRDYDSLYQHLLARAGIPVANAGAGARM